MTSIRAYAFVCLPIVALLACSGGNPQNSSEAPQNAAGRGNGGSSGTGIGGVGSNMAGGHAAGSSSGAAATGGSLGSGGGSSAGVGGGGTAGSSSVATAGTGGSSGGSAGDSSSGGLDEATYLDVIRFDFSGENGVPYGTGHAPFAPSIGYPAGVPNGYNWKFAMTGTADVAGMVSGWSNARNAGAAYDQVYQHRPGDGAAPNARVLLEPLQTYYFSIASNTWRQVETQPVGGAAFAEDFLNNQAVGADSRSEAAQSISVRSGSNASGDAGGLTGRTTDDGPIGYNFHGFDHRFEVDWSDVRAIVVTEVMSCIPDAGTDLSDCNKQPYIANVGLDSWASTTSGFDGFKTHGGIGGGRFKPVTTARQLFTNYNGPLALLDQHPPPIPSGF